MRSGILCTLLFFVFVYLLRFPEDAFQASASGVTLWFFHVLPSLLPFMILSDFFIHTGLASVLLQKTKGIFRFLFGLSMYGSYAFLLGLFCGYPMGAKLTADLFAEGKITKSEAQYLLTICNNPGPMSYLLVDTLHLSHAAGHTFLILYLSLFLTSLIFRLLLKPDCRDLTTAPVSPSSESFRKSVSHMIDASIIHAFETITKLGGYIILFSILASLVVRCSSPVPVLSVFLTGLTEMTTGIALVGASSLKLSWRYLLSLTFASFGGLSCIAQTRGMLVGTPLSIRTYIAGKTVHAVCTLFVGWLLLFVQIFH